MNTFPSHKLLIRTAAIKDWGSGYIYACDTEKDEEDPHTVTFLWDEGDFISGECNYNAHSICFITAPEFALVDLCEQGGYAVNAVSGMTSGDIFEDSHPAAEEMRFGGFRSVSEVDGKAYAVGFRGMVYRLDKIGSWTRIDDGLPDSFDIDAIHGFSGSDMYAVGLRGALWHYNGDKWTRLDLPTNIHLSAVKCAGDGKVYIAGHNGMLLRGRDEAWEIIEHEATEDNIWDLEWFEEELYLSTMRNVYRLDGDTLVPVDFGEDKPASCYQLSKAEGVMWSNGEYDIMSFDGETWTRIV